MPEQEPKGSCDVCRKPAKQFCASCKAVFYCSKECQKRGWKDHKTKCRPFTVQIHPVYGRHVVATRDIKPGEIILKEKPIIVGPKQKSTLLCLGCHKPAVEAKCPRCGYPLCNINCQKYHKNECSILSRGKFPGTFDESTFSAIMALRCLLTQTLEPKTWDIINTFQDHLAEIKKGELYPFFKTKVVDFIRENLSHQEYDETTILKVCGILTTNCFEIKQNGGRVRGLYNIASKMAHSCIPNTKHIIENDTTAVFISTVKITKGSSVTTNYTQVLWNTMARRQHLKMLKFFLCTCVRCSDPSELGTNYSTLICNKCSGPITSKNPLNLDSDWMCYKCTHLISAKQVRWGDAVFFRELRELNKDSPKALEDFLEKYKKTLHAQNRFFMEAKYGLIKLYGNTETARYRDMTRTQLENKVKWCRELMELAEVIDPGLSLLRGSILFELQAALVALAKHLLSNDIITQEAAKEYMTEAASVLQEASVILKHEPELRDGGLTEKLGMLSQELEM